MEVAVFFIAVIGFAFLLHRLNEAELKKLHRKWMHEATQKCPPHKWVKNEATDSTICGRCKFIVGVDSKGEGEE